MNVAVYVVHGRELFELFHRADCTHGSRSPALRAYDTSPRGVATTTRDTEIDQMAEPSRSVSCACQGEQESRGDAGSKQSDRKETVKKTTSNFLRETTVHGNYLRNICVAPDT
jgi:hypothetical protein